MSRAQLVTLLLTAAALGSPEALAAQAPAYDRATPLPARVPIARADEIRMARAAAPAAVSDHATIWVGGARGYEIAVQGTNGWGCFVQRNSAGTGTFPRCDDAERVASLYPVYHLLEAYRAQGRSANAYDRDVAAGYASGNYRAPVTGAMSYMLAEGVIPPHFMVSVPHCTVEKLGLATPEQMADTTLKVVFRGLDTPDCDLVVFTPPESRRHHGVVVGRPR